MKRELGGLFGSSADGVQRGGTPLPRISPGGIASGTFYEISAMVIAASAALLVEIDHEMSDVVKWGGGQDPDSITRI